MLVYSNFNVVIKIICLYADKILLKMLFLKIEH